MPLPSRTARRVLAALLVALIAAAGALGVEAAGVLDRVESDTVDVRFGLRGERPAPELVVVAIDDVTFSELRVHWPFPRRLHARVIDRLRAAGAKAIVYDVQFTERTTDRDDLALYEAVGRADGIILATSEMDDRGGTMVLGGDENLAAVGARAAASNVSADERGVIRRVSGSVGGLTTMAVATAEALGHPPSPSRFDGAGALIDYRGGPKTIRTVSFSRVLRGQVDPALLRGRIVVVGPSAPSLQDVHTTPTAGDSPMAGAEIQANAIWTALHDAPLRDAPAWMELLAVALLSVVAPLAALRLRLVWVASGALALAAAWAVVVQGAFQGGTVLALTTPLVALALATAATFGEGYASETRERRRGAWLNTVLEGEVHQRTEELRRTQLEVIHRLAQAAEQRDHDTGLHIERIGRLSEALGAATGMSAHEAEELRHASVMHDVGKIGIPDAILLKPGPFEGDERDVMRTHTLIGGAILSGSESPVVRLGETIARTHHERWDGSGYPSGLAGEEIPLAGRICAICDVFDALLSRRPYKDPWSLDEALEELAHQRGRLFDPRLVDLFLPIARRLHAELGYFALEPVPQEAPAFA